MFFEPYKQAISEKQFKPTHNKWGGIKIHSALLTFNSTYRWTDVNGNERNLFETRVRQISVGRQPEKWYHLFPVLMAVGRAGRAIFPHYSVVAGSRFISSVCYRKGTSENIWIQLYMQWMRYRWLHHRWPLLIPL